jgi:hypothetical protein
MKTGISLISANTSISKCLCGFRVSGSNQKNTDVFSSLISGFSVLM